MILKFHGVVSGGDGYRVAYGDDEKDGSIWIGDEDVVGAVDAALVRRREALAAVPDVPNGRAHFDAVGKPVIPVRRGRAAVKPRPVTFAVADERYEGEIAVGLGWGYSEYTPMDEDELTVGPHNVIEILERYMGQTITAWFADEPFNTLEDTQPLDTETSSGVAGK